MPPCLFFGCHLVIYFSLHLSGYFLKGQFT